MIDPDTLKEVPRSQWPYENKDCLHVYKNANTVIQVLDNKAPATANTPWEGTLLVSIKHTRAKNPKQYAKGSHDIEITWDDLYAVKKHLWPNQIALEIHPPTADLVNVANMRWLWILPTGAMIPFNLNEKEIMQS